VVTRVVTRRTVPRGVMVLTVATAPRALAPVRRPERGHGPQRRQQRHGGRQGNAR